MEPKSTPTKMAFAIAIRRRRVRRRLSQDQLAQEGISRSHVSDLERGLIDPKLTTILKLARILEVRPGVLVTEIERILAKLAKKPAA